MKHFIIISIVIVIFFAGCRQSHEETIVPEFGKHPGVAVIGNENITVIYSDDSKAFDNELPVSGGILEYYFNGDSVNYIRGSKIQFVDETGIVTVNRDTFGLDPFFAPFRKIYTDNFESNMKIFATGEGLIVRQISISALAGLHTSVEWSLHTPAMLESAEIISSDILADGIYHRYDNNTILAIAGSGENSQFNFNANEGITTVTTPLQLDAGRDTTLTFFIVSGQSDTDVITKMFAAETGDLFESAYRHWNNRLAGQNIPVFPHDIFVQCFRSNTYPVYLSNADGYLPPQYYKSGDLSELAEKAREYIAAGNRESAQEMIHYLIGNTNSYGLLPEMEGETIITPVSVAGSAELLNLLALFYQEPV